MIISRQVRRRGDYANAGVRFLEHDPEKWKPVFGQDHAQTKILDYDPIQLNWIIV
jgi:hypothetical protein